MSDFNERNWLAFIVELKNHISHDNHFDALVQFLKKQGKIHERLEQLKIVDKTDKSDQLPVKKCDKKYDSTKTTKYFIMFIFYVVMEGTVNLFL